MKREKDAGDRQEEEMIRLERTAVMNLENAIRGMRNPFSSWEKSDSYYDEDGCFVLGGADLSLAHRLAVSGRDHRKYLRQIFVSVDITAPIYWWKEFDTYKVATVANSTSTMHKIHAKPFTKEDFSVDHLTDEGMRAFEVYLGYLESARKKYVETKDKRYWYDLIQLLPSGYNQMRTVTLNYETLVNIYYARRNHKLDEWHRMCEWISTLPYAGDIIMVKDE